jgi:hypothetical protein
MGGLGAALDAIASGDRRARLAGRRIDAREWLAARNRSGSPCIRAGATLADLSVAYGCDPAVSCRALGLPFMASRTASARCLRAANSCKGCRAGVS